MCTFVWVTAFQCTHLLVIMITVVYYLYEASHSARLLLMCYCLLEKCSHIRICRSSLRSH
jgi:hypothetical protein